MKHGSVLTVDARKLKNPLRMFTDGNTATKEEVQKSIYKTFFLLFETAEETLNPIAKKLLYWIMAAWIVYTEHDTGLQTPGRLITTDLGDVDDMLAVYQDMGFEAPIATWEDLYAMPTGTSGQKYKKRVMQLKVQKYIKKCYNIVEPIGFEFIKSRIKYKDDSMPILLAFCLGRDSCQLSTDLGHHFAAILPRAYRFPVLEQYYPTVRKWKERGFGPGSGYTGGYTRALANFLGAN